MTGAATAATPEVLARLHAACFPASARWDAAAMAALLATPGCLAIAEPFGLAMLRVASDEAEILTLGVLPGQRRRGHARVLLEYALRAAAAAGAARMYLEVARRNQAAIALYESRGFVDVGYRPDYYPDGDAAVVMALTLDRSPSAGDPGADDPGADDLGADDRDD